MNSYGLVVTLDGVDVSCHAYEPVEVTWGREAPGDSFEPRRCVIGFGPEAAAQRGQTLDVEMTAPQSTLTWATTPGTWATQVGTWASRRIAVKVFHGRITDTSVSWTPQVAETEWGVVVDVIAVDPIADLARLPIGDTPWPQETVTARATRIQALTPLAWTTEPSALVVAARDVDEQPALDLLDDLTNDASLSGGITYDPNTSLARFTLDALRMGTLPDHTITRHQMLDSAQQVSAIGDVINDVTVTYVDPLDTSARPSVRRVNAASVAADGRRNATVSTHLVDAAAAEERCAAVLARHAVDTTRFESIVLDSRVASVVDIAEAFLAAGPGVRVRLAELPPPAVETWDGYLEGWSFTGSVDSWDVTINLSPASWSGPLMTWSGIGSGTWGDVAPTWRWMDALVEMEWSTP